MPVLLKPRERASNDTRDRRGVDLLKTRPTQRSRECTNEPLKPLSELSVSDNRATQIVNTPCARPMHYFLGAKCAFRLCQQLRVCPPSLGFTLQQSRQLAAHANLSGRHAQPVFRRT